MSLVEISNSQSEGFYLPHYAVFKESSNTTKLRVVFDASTKSTNGYSLNDNLLVGAIIQDDLFNLLLRFRTHTHVIIADIEKMYRQFLIRGEDNKFYNNEIREYTLNTVTFGVNAAPYLAIRCLHQLAVCVCVCVCVPLYLRIYAVDFNQVGLIFLFFYSEFGKKIIFYDSRSVLFYVEFSIFEKFISDFF